MSVLKSRDVCLPFRECTQECGRCAIFPKYKVKIVYHTGQEQRRITLLTFRIFHLYELSFFLFFFLFFKKCLEPAFNSQIKFYANQHHCYYYSDEQHGSLTTMFTSSVRRTKLGFSLTFYNKRLWHSTAQRTNRFTTITSNNNVYKIRIQRDRS